MKKALIPAWIFFFFFQAGFIFAENPVLPAGMPPMQKDGQKNAGAGTPLEYRVQPEDVLQITVYEEPDLTTRARVSSDGQINIPLLGQINITAMTVGEIQEKITKALGEDYLVNPQVQVFVAEYRPRNVFVTGSVSNPGSYSLAAGKRTTIMEVIAMAGGFRQNASINSTRIIRIQNNKETTIVVKAKDIVKGDKRKDVEILPDDVVFVPESIF